MADDLRKPFEQPEHRVSDEEVAAVRAQITALKMALKAAGEENKAVRADRDELRGHLALLYGRQVDEEPSELERLRHLLATERQGFGSRTVATWDEYAQHWRGRAEQAERRLADFRRFLDEDFRQWCSPHGIAPRYATDLITILDGTEEAPRG